MREGGEGGGGKRGAVSVDFGDGGREEGWKKTWMGWVGEWAGDVG